MFSKAAVLPEGSHHDCEERRMHARKCPLSLLPQSGVQKVGAYIQECMVLLLQDLHVTHSRRDGNILLLPR